MYVKQLHMLILKRLAHPVHITYQQQNDNNKIIIKGLPASPREERSINNKNKIIANLNPHALCLPRQRAFFIWVG